MDKHFRGCISAFLVVLLTFAAISGCFAENVDLSSMDVDELIALRDSVNAELTSRPEASPFKLNAGLYVVGEDIKAGKYYVAPEAPSDYTARIVIYADKEHQNADICIHSEYFDIEDPAVMIALEDGNLINVIEAPLMFSITGFEGDKYFTYTPPEETYVPAGIYTVGVEIPAGTYQLFPAAFKTAGVRIYQNSINDEDCENIRFSDTSYTPGSYRTAIFSDGNVVEIFDPIIMKKQPKLSFE